MSGDLEGIARRLEVEGHRLEARAIRAVEAAYGRLSLADLLALLEGLSARPTSQKRIAGLDKLLAAFDEAVLKLATPPPQMATLLEAAVESGTSAGAAMLAIHGKELDAFRVPPVLQRQFVERSMARFENYWGIERPRFRAAVQSALLEGLDRGTGPAAVAAQLRRATGESTTRSLLIARTELGRASSFANEQTQRRAGVKEFIWRATRDSRTRESHRQRDGHIYSWEDPPGGEVPGEPFRCRCVALAVLPGGNGAP